MKGLFKYGAIASVFLLTAAPVAFAQTYNPSSGSDWNQGSGWHQGNQGWHQGAMNGGSWNQSGNQGYNQGGMSGGWNQSGNQGYNQGGFSGSTQGANQGENQGPSEQDAYRELSRYGFNNLRNLQRSEGWEAHATKNGDRVHVFIDDDGMIATYRGE